MAEYPDYAALAAAEVEGADYTRTVRPVNGSAWTSIAIHGGGIEIGTEEMAFAVGKNLMSTYVFAGIKTSDNSTLHITSTNFDEPLCEALVAPASRTLSFHGYVGTDGVAETALGGLDTWLARRVSKELTDRGFRVITAPSEIAGTDPLNICNRNARGAGVQLEMSRALRQSFFPDDDWSRSVRESGRRTQTFYDYVDAIRSAVDVPGEPHTTHVPLTVRLSTSRGNRDVTRDLRELSFRWTDPGGYATCQISVDRPLTFQPNEIAAFGRLTVYDARHGGIVWDGRLEDPGRSGGGSNGEVWELTAVGGRAHTKDNPRPLTYIETSHADIVQRQDATAGAEAGVQENDLGVPAAVVKFPEGSTVVPGSIVTMQWSNLYYADQRLARISVFIDSGRTDAEYRWIISGKTGATGFRSSRSATISTGHSQEVKYVGTGANGGMSIAHDIVQFQMESITANGKPTNDTVWTAFYDLNLKAVRYLANGFQVTDYASETDTLFASDVVNDLLGRLLPHYDGERAVIESNPATDFQIDQLAYPDGTTAEQVLSDLMMYDRYTWRVWEARPLERRSGTLGTEDFEDSTFIFYIQPGTWSRTTSGLPIDVWAMRSEVGLGSGETSDMIVTVPPGATGMTFHYRVSSEENFDLFEVLLDGRQVLVESGDVGWLQSTVYDVSAVSKVTFRYTKDGTTLAGDDVAYIDNLTFFGKPGAPPHHRYRFEWVALPSTVRYEADITDGYTSQGSSDTVYNQVVVRWTDGQGKARSVRRFADVPILDAAGLTRVGEIDIGFELSGQSAAERIGDQWLAEHSVPLNSGQLRIARPIRDLESGRMVQPWEIRPGLIRVRGIQPHVDSLNATDRDGVTVFRIIASDFNASDGAATLELDSPASTLSRMLARQEHRPEYVKGTSSARPVRWTGRRR